MLNKTILFTFILLASSTYRCKEDELLIDCEAAASEMVGTWTGYHSTTNKSFNEPFTLTVTESHGCIFTGVTTYAASETSFFANGSIDEYGWLEFTELKFMVDGGEYTSCVGSWWQCRNIRWKIGALFDGARFRNTTMSGNFYLNSFGSGYWYLNKQ